MSEIRIENLNKKIKGSVILNDISLTMTLGRIYGLRGKNGWGKTMLMRAICGLLIPDGGHIYIDDEELHRDIKFPRSIGALIENPSFLPQYTGFRNLRLLAKLMGGISDDDVRYAIERTGLDPDDKRVYRKYSLGMKQKLGIANAIMGEPDVIVLDEPINALDEAGAKQVHEILEEQKKRGALIIIACHDKEELEMLSDEIIEISERRIIEK